MSGNPSALDSFFIFFLSLNAFDRILGALSSLESLYFTLSDCIPGLMHVDSGQ